MKVGHSGDLDLWTAKTYQCGGGGGQGGRTRYSAIVNSLKAQLLLLLSLSKL